MVSAQRQQRASRPSQPRGQHQILDGRINGTKQSGADGRIVPAGHRQAAHYNHGRLIEVFDVIHVLRIDAATVVVCIRIIQNAVANVLPPCLSTSGRIASPDPLIGHNDEGHQLKIAGPRRHAGSFDDKLEIFPGNRVGFM